MTVAETPGGKRMTKIGFCIWAELVLEDGFKKIQYIYLIIDSYFIEYINALICILYDNFLTDFHVRILCLS